MGLPFDGVIDKVRNNLYIYMGLPFDGVIDKVRNNLYIYMGLPFDGVIDKVRNNLLPLATHIQFYFNSIYNTSTNNLLTRLFLCSTGVIDKTCLTVDDGALKKMTALSYSKPKPEVLEGTQAIRSINKWLTPSRGGLKVRNKPINNLLTTYQQPN